MKLVSISYVFVLSQSGPKKMINLYELTNFLVISTTVMWDEKNWELEKYKKQTENIIKSNPFIARNIKLCAHEEAEQTEQTKEISIFIIFATWTSKRSRNFHQWKVHKRLRAIREMREQVMSEKENFVNFRASLFQRNRLKTFWREKSPRERKSRKRSGRVCSSGMLREREITSVPLKTFACALSSLRRGEVERKKNRTIVHITIIVHHITFH